MKEMKNAIDSWKNNKKYKHGLFLDEFKGNQEIYNKFVYTGLTRFSMGVDFVKDFER